MNEHLITTMIVCGTALLLGSLVVYYLLEKLKHKPAPVAGLVELEDRLTAHTRATDARIYDIELVLTRDAQKADDREARFKAQIEEATSERTKLSAMVAQARRS